MKINAVIIIGEADLKFLEILAVDQYGTPADSLLLFSLFVI